MFGGWYVIELALIGLTITGFLLVLDRKDQRQQAETSRLLERFEALVEAHRVELVGVFASHREEVAVLCQRIQAPEVAVIEHNQAQQAPPSVQHAMTDEQAAEAEERARVIAEMERLENEALR